MVLEMSSGILFLLELEVVKHFENSLKMRSIHFENSLKMCSIHFENS